MGWRKFAILDQNRHFSQKWYKIGPWLLWITIASRSVHVDSEWVTLKRWWVIFFWQISIIMLLWFDRDWPIWHSNSWGEACS